MENNSDLIVLGIHPNFYLVQSFIDYLNAKNIPASIEPSATGWCVQVSSQTAPQARQYWIEFLDNPLHERYLQASWASNQVLRLSLHGFMASLVNSRIWHEAGWVTWGIMGICGLIFGVSAIGWADEIFKYLKFFDALSLTELTAFWRWLTPSFIHFSSLHLMLNLVWWWYLGGRLERNLGALRLLQILIVSSIVACLVQFYFVDSYFGGLSGVVFGLVGYYFMGGYCYKNTLLMIEPPLLIMMGLSLLLGLSGFMNVAVANGAHFGGLLAGMLLALLNRRRDGGT